jgi:hypothetical protein
MHISRGGGQWLVALGQQHVHQGGGAVLVSREAHVTSSFVGLMIAGRASVDGRARTLARVSLQTAIVTVAAFGLGLLIGRRRAR